MSALRIAIDGNEANVPNRVGSNVYAFEIIAALEKLTKEKERYLVTVLLSAPPLKDLPKTRKGWTYQVITPTFLWTQCALPVHLFVHKNKYDVFFTPGHYAPRVSAVPYVSSVMDLAFLTYPEQFQHSDLIQLKNWTAYSVKHAKKVIAISQATKGDVVMSYGKKPADVVVAYPAIEPIVDTSPKEVQQFFNQHHLNTPYFLFMGTFQPRKNLIRLVEAYELICRRIASQSTTIKKKMSIPQLVLAGKIGWLADDILGRIKQSPFYDFIVLPGFVPDEVKPALYHQATASILVGLYEGFGLPPLESLHYGCIPIVSDTSSLPEVVGEAGIQVNPLSIQDIAAAMEKTLRLTAKQKAQYRKKAREQVKKFSWEKSAQQVLEVLESVANKN